MIKLVVLDIDGVITDGSVIIDAEGNEQKKINLKDVDAIYDLRREGLLLAAVTGEKSEIVSYFEKRFPWDYFYKGKKKKLEVIHEIEALEGLKPEEICYIGDGRYDVEPLAYAGLGICPADAVRQAKNAAAVVLRAGGGQGGLWEAADWIKIYQNKEAPENYFYQRLKEHEIVWKRMVSDQKLAGRVMCLAQKIVSSMKAGGRLLLCGNGGSAADAQHIAAEFIGRFYQERPAMNAEALGVNTSALTAIGNDYGFESVFLRQVEAKAKKGDVLIGLSTSGGSQNILSALRYAKAEGICTAMLTGACRAPQLEDICDYLIQVPSDVTPRIQEAHIFIGHALAEYVEFEMFGSQDR